LALQDSAWEAVADSALVLMAGRPVSERDQLRRVALLAFERLGADHPSTIAARSRMATLLY
jgi:thioredoxin-like negative regulator of GroEL